MVTVKMRRAKQPRSSKANKLALLVPLFGVALLICIDQLAKWLVRESLSHSQGIKLLGFLEIVNITNTGSAFGILQGTQPFLIVLGLVSAAVLSFAYFRLESRLQRLGAALVVAGIPGDTIYPGGARGVSRFFFLAALAGF